MPSILLIVALAALVWWTVMVRQWGLIAGGLLTLLAGICFGHPFFHSSFLTIDRALVGVLLATYFVMRGAGGCPGSPPLSRLDLLFAAYIGYVAVSTFTHDWRWEQNLPASRFVFYYALPAVMYFIGRQTELTPRKVRVLLGCLTGFGLYVALTAIAENAELYHLVFPRYIAAPAFEEFFGRGRGPLLNPVANGILLTVGLASLLLLCPPRNRIGLLGIASGSLLLLGGLYSTLTRSTWMAAVCAVALIAALTLPRRLLRGAVIVSVVSSVFVLPVVYNSAKAFKRDKHVSVSEMASSASLRPVLAYVAWQMFCDHPLVGVGHGHYKRLDKFYLQDRSTELVLDKARPYHQHNVFLAILTEMGLIGTLLFGALWIQWSRVSLSLCLHSGPTQFGKLGILHLSLLLAYAVNGMFHDVSIMPMIQNTLFFFAGLTVGQALRLEPAASQRPLAWRPVWPWFGRRQITT